jgi:hypothetical protein
MGLRCTGRPISAVQRRLLLSDRLVWYFRTSLSGNNSVVECDLAKVEVAGSNPVSRSIFLIPFSGGSLRCHSAGNAPLARFHSI